MHVHRWIKHTDEHARQMCACIGSRNYRCMCMNISIRGINAAAVPLLQQVLVKFGREEKVVWWVNCIARSFTIRQSTFFCLFYFPSLQIPYWSNGLGNFIKSLFIALFFHFISSVTTCALAPRRDSLQRVSSNGSPDQFTRSRLSDSLRPRRFNSLRVFGGARPRATCGEFWDCSPALAGSRSRR